MTTKRVWTPEEDEKLIALYKLNYNVKGIGTILRRSKNAVGLRISRLRRSNRVLVKES